METKVKEYAEYLIERYESDRLYDEVLFDEFVRNEIATCAEPYREVVMSVCETEEEAIESFVTLCEYLMK